MIFTDAIFFAFLAVVFAAHWLLRGREVRLGVLLVASLVFYGWWNWKLLGLLGLVVVLSWLTAKLAAQRPAGDRVRRRILIAGIGGNLLVLAAFKYAGFFAESARAALAAFGIEAGWPLLNIILPMGISFYVFQAISYIVDVARGQLPAEQRLRRVALYIAFFPQLVAGPIVRAASFFPQMERDRRLTGALLASGARAFLLGLVYKAGIADHLAPFVDPIFGDARIVGDSAVSEATSLALIGATMAFGALIYFDFAGYSLMAIGVARWFGYYIPKNFDYPYSAISLQDFWRRWHISLSSWLRDYLYIPLGGNRGGAMKTSRNLMATMVLGGLWHGAAWTFVVWGAMHGAGLIVNRLFRRPLGWALGLILTQVFVLLTWVPFRAESFGDVLEVWWAFTGLRGGGTMGITPGIFAVAGIVALDALVGRKARRLKPLRDPLLYWIGLGVLVAAILALYPLEAAPFVYFQF